MESVKTLLDTNVVVAAMVSTHTKHEIAARAWEEARRGEACICAHSLAEVWATLTRLPIRPPISAAQASTLIEERVMPTTTTLTLDPGVYKAALTRVTRLGMKGGIIHDAVILECGLGHQIDRVVTLNGRHFRRLWPDAGSRLHALA